MGSGSEGPASATSGSGTSSDATASRMPAVRREARAARRAAGEGKAARYEQAPPRRECAREGAGEATAAVAGTARAEEATITPVFNPERASRFEKEARVPRSRRRWKRVARS